jgi:hypothetical protein
MIRRRWKVELCSCRRFVIAGVGTVDDGQVLHASFVCQPLWGQVLDA